MPHGAARSRHNGRNRDEIRIVTIFDPADKRAGTEWHPYIATIIRVERNVFTRSAATGLLKTSTETAFYVSNTTLTATRAAEAIRAHYSRDVTVAEDASHIRTNPTVFARLRSFAFNIQKTNRTNTLSQDRYRAALIGIKKLLKLIKMKEG